MSPNTTPSAPPASTSAPPAWCARGCPTRGCGAGRGSSAASVPAPRRVGALLIPASYPRRPASGRLRRGGCRGRRLRPRRAARPLLAGLQEPVAELRLLLGRRVPLGRVGEVLEGLEAEELQEQRRRAVQDGAELRAPGLLDQAALEERRGGR